MINDRISKLRNVMKEKNIFAYIIPSADYHQSEYVGEFFKGRQFISGFTDINCLPLKNSPAYSL